MEAFPLIPPQFSSNKTTEIGKRKIDWYLEIKVSVSMGLVINGGSNDK